MSWTVAGAALGGVAGSFAGGFSVAAGIQGGATIGAILDGVTNRPKAPKVHLDRYYSGAQYESGIPRVWGRVRLDVGIIWVARNSDGTFLRIREEGENKKKGTPGVPHAHGTYAMCVAETGLTFPNGNQVERRIVIDRIRQADTMVYVGEGATPIPAWDSGETYGFGDTVTHSGDYYTSKADDNTNHTPSGSSPWWQKVSKAKKNLTFVQHPDEGESTFLMDADSTMSTHDGIENTRAYRTLTYLMVPDQDFFRLGNNLPTNTSIECHSEEDLTHGDFLSDAFQLAGLEPEEFDVSAVASVPLVGGIVQPQQMSVQELIANFLMVNSYEIAEIDGKVTVVVRGGPIVRTIEDYDLGAESGDRGSQAVPYEILADRLELHSSVSLSYSSINQNFRKVGALAVWPDPQTYNPLSIDSGLVMDDDEAIRAAYRLLDAEHLERGGDYGPIKLPVEYADLVPSDPILVRVNGTLTRFRVEKTDNNEVVGLQIVRDEPEILNQEAIGELGDVGSEGTEIKPLAFRIASPPIDITDNFATYPGVYVWASDGTSNAQIDGDIWLSFDDFATDAVYGGKVKTQSNFGEITTNALVDYAGAANGGSTDDAYVKFDVGSRMSVSPGAANSLLAVLSGANPTLIGDEWLAVTSADLPSGGTQRMATYVRRLRSSPGTGHGLGEQLAHSSHVRNLLKVKVDPSYVGQTVYVRVLAPGQEIDDVASRSCTIVDPARPYETPSIARQETPVGTLDGVNAVFTLTYDPIAGTLILTKNGTQQVEGVDFTLSANAITFTTAPLVGDVLYANYRSAS